MAMLAVVCVESIERSPVVSLPFLTARARKKAHAPSQSLPLCSSDVLVNGGRVEMTPRAVEQRLRLVEGRPVPVMESMPYFSVAHALKIERQAAQSGRASLALRTRSLVRLDFGCVSRLNMFVVVVAY